MSVLLETSLGDITIDLLVDDAPKCCEKYVGPIPTRARVHWQPSTACACVNPLSFQAEHRTDTDSWPVASSNSAR
jgi:hypothetical protein